MINNLKIELIYYRRAYTRQIARGHLISKDGEIVSIKSAKSFILFDDYLFNEFWHTVDEQIANTMIDWSKKTTLIGPLAFLYETLTDIASKEYQMRVWYRSWGSEIDWYEECSLVFDDQIDYLKQILREGKVRLTTLQIKAILRVHAGYKYGIHSPV